MKSLKYLSGLVVLFSLASVPSAVAGSNTVAVTNDTPYTMTEFYASPSSSAAWDMTLNLLAGQTVAPGQTTTITVASSGGDGGDSCKYDLMAVMYGDAEHGYQYRVDVCEGASWSVSQ